MNEEEKKAIERIEDTFYSDLGKGINKFQKITLYEDSIKDVRIVLNLLEKLQKENEELKQDRNNNYQMIALAQNEVLGYMQGYEDGKKLNRSAVACVVENQQYYIIKKEIEHYKENIEKLQKENELAKKQVEYDKTHIFTPQTIKLNYIPIQKVKDKIRHYQELQDNYIKKYDEINEGLQAMINVLQELLEGRK